MRKSYLTNTFADTKKEMNKMANVMCHSTAMQMAVYVKEDGGVI